MSLGEHWTRRPRGRYSTFSELPSRRRSVSSSSPADEGARFWPDTAPLQPHPCACHRDPAAVRPHGGRYDATPACWTGPVGAWFLPNKAPLQPHPCARHRDPAAVRPHGGKRHPQRWPRPLRAEGAARLKSCDRPLNGAAAARPPPPAGLLHHHMALFAEREPERLSADGYQSVRILDDLAVDPDAAAGNRPPCPALR
ncbi:hypothetical protein OKW20_002597 [Ensifer sp. LBL]